MLAKKAKDAKSPAWKALAEVIDEFTSAQKAYPVMASPHEGFAILLEEVDELKNEVWKKPSVRSKDSMRAEARQIAAMALRFMADLT